MGMAFDAAHGRVVLFGGAVTGGFMGDTWTWDGATWTQQHPATSPPPRMSMGMAYDATRGQVVLFGGFNGSWLGDTWIWDGTTWAQQHPATSPSPRTGSGMADDPVHGLVVLFGGFYEPLGSSSSFSSRSVPWLRDTWVWDGTTWTMQHLDTRPTPREGMGMADDPANGQVVLFGGYSNWTGYAGDTWTWDGTSWTKERPVGHPSPRENVRMAYEPANGQVVLFGGFDGGQLGDTSVWDGTTWTQQHPSTAPTPRELVGMAADARGQVTLFGGTNGRDLEGDTWTWDGTTWSIPFRAELLMSPDSGPPGTAVQVTGDGFAAFDRVTVFFIDSGTGRTSLGTFTADATGHLSAQVSIPLNATVGPQTMVLVGGISGQRAKALFTVT
jgi:hypothetical protein